MNNTYARVMLSPRWRMKAHLLKGWAGSCCEVCGVDDELEVHHITYENLGTEQPTDLVVLCGRCHEGRHAFNDPDGVRLRQIASRHPESFLDVVQQSYDEGQIVQAELTTYVV